MSRENSRDSQFCLRGGEQTSRRAGTRQTSGLWRHEILDPEKLDIWPFLAYRSFSAGEGVPRPALPGSHRMRTAPNGALDRSMEKYFEGKRTAQWILHYTAI